jgi:hypothetical protein
MPGRDASPRLRIVARERSSVAPVQRSRRRRRPEAKLAEACNHNPRRYLDSLLGLGSALSPDLVIPALSLKYGTEKDLTQVLALRESDRIGHP